MTLDLEGELRRLRLPDGRYAAPEPAPRDKPDAYAAFADALATALAEPPDPKHAAEAALRLIETFPGCRVGKAAYATGLGDVVGDDGIPPCVVRHVCRSVRAEVKALPPLAELRERMLAELRARRDLLARLESFPRRLAEAHKRDMEEAARIAAAAARRGATLPPSDIVATWHRVAEGGRVAPAHRPPGDARGRRLRRRRLRDRRVREWRPAAGIRSRCRARPRPRRL